MRLWPALFSDFLSMEPGYFGTNAVSFEISAIHLGPADNASVSPEHVLGFACTSHARDGHQAGRYTLLF